MPELEELEEIKRWVILGLTILLHDDYPLSDQDKHLIGSATEHLLARGDTADWLRRVSDGQ